MLIVSRLVHFITISFLISLVSSQGNLSKEKEERKVELASQMMKQRLDNLQSEMKNMNIELQHGFNDRTKEILQFQAATSKKIEQLEEIGKEIHAWSEFMKKLNQYVTKGNDALISFNDKVASVMTKVVGFEEQMKAIVSLDTLVVCILSLVLVKILKDEFIDEGYQLVRDSSLTPIGEISSSGVFGQRQNAQ